MKDSVLQSRIVQYGCTHENPIAKTPHTDFGILSPFARVEVAIFALDDFAKTGRKSALAAATPEAVRGLLGSQFMSQLEATDGRILEIPNYKYEHRYNVKTGVNDVVKTSLTYISDDLVNRFLEVTCLYASHGCLPPLKGKILCRSIDSAITRKLLDNEQDNLIHFLRDPLSFQVILVPILHHAHFCLA